MDLVRELRKFEGINASFDYGVELVVMAIKPFRNLDEMVDAIANNEERFADLFNYDFVCKKGFDVGKTYINSFKEFDKEYQKFIRIFREDETCYASITEYTILLSVEGKGEIFKKQQIREIKTLIKNEGFGYSVSEPKLGKVLIKVMPKA